MGLKLGQNYYKIIKLSNKLKHTYILTNWIKLYNLNKII